MNTAKPVPSGQSLPEVNLGFSTSRGSQLTGRHLVLPIAGVGGASGLIQEQRGRWENLSRMDD